MTIGRSEHERARDHAMNRINACPRVSPAHDDSALFLRKLARPVRILRLSLRPSRLVPDRFHPHIPTPEPNLSPSTPCAGARRGWSRPVAPSERAMVHVSRSAPDLSPQPLQLNPPNSRDKSSSTDAQLSC